MTFVGGWELPADGKNPTGRKEGTLFEYIDGGVANT